MIYRRFLAIVSAFILVTGGPSVSHAESSSEEFPQEQPIPETRKTASLAHIVRAKKESTIQDMVIPSMDLPIVMVNSKQKLRPMVEVPLIFHRPGWSLYIQNKYPVTPTAEVGKYKVFAYMNSRINELLLVARGPQGEKETERIYIYAPEAQEFSVVSPWDAVKLTLGSTYLIYNQTGFNTFQSWSGLLQAQLRSPEESGQFGYLAEASMTAMTVTSNQNNYGPQIGQGSVNGIYFFPWSLASLWRYQVFAGGEYTTFISNGAPFGFKNLLTADIGFRARYILDTKSDILIETKLLPMSSSLDFAERGFMLAVSKSWILPNLHRGELGFRYYDLDYKPFQDGSVSLKTFSLTVGYSL